VPELPDLQVIRDVLDPALSGQTVIGVDVVRPLVVRDLTGDGLAEAVTGRTINRVRRRGKVLVFVLVPELFVAVNCKLAGRLQYASSDTRRLAKTQVEFQLSGGQVLRYSDRRTMGQMYVTHTLDAIPGWAEMGPEPFDVTAGEFHERLRPYRGEIKGILTRGRVVAGIGNAYADEICFAAGLHPFRKRTSLTTEETDRLYSSMHIVLRDAIKTLRQRVGTEIHREIRDFLAVHGRGGSECPVCGNTLSEIKARGRLTNFCRQCQPGGLIRL
jgi:formamidopyrimidine-DNA glycosylase